jgi:hypothetical protein|tara:strand:- start:561 stop:758 length:198 start_codon:yes stop_codon:yes gene_type:complete
MGGRRRMKIIKLSDKKFWQLQKYVNDHVEFIIDSCAGCNDNDLLEKLMEKSKPIFDLQESMMEAE